MNALDGLPFRRLTIHLKATRQVAYWSPAVPHNDGGTSTRAQACGTFATAILSLGLSGFRRYSYPSYHQTLGLQRSTPVQHAPSHNLVNGSHGPYRISSHLLTRLEGIILGSPHSRHDPSHFRQAEVPIPSCRNDERTHLLVFQSLEKALRDALKSVLEKDAPPDPKTKFYSKFKEEVAEHDDDFLTKHDEDMNNTLIFVSSAPPTESVWLTRWEVWSVFSHRRRIHNRRTVRTQAGL